MEITGNEKPNYTAEQFFAIIPEENTRAELINGEIVMLAGASEIHQRIAGGVYVRFYNFIEKNKGGCMTYQPPFDVVFDDNNVFQPDVMIFCDRSKVGDKRAYGAPDLVVEVLSDNRKRDLIDKCAKYANSGVREYWIIDPVRERSIVYQFGEPVQVDFFGFDQPIPVGIWDNGLEIKISELLGW